MHSADFALACTFTSPLTQEKMGRCRDFSYALNLKAGKASRHSPISSMWLLSKLVLGSCALKNPNALASSFLAAGKTVHSKSSLWVPDLRLPSPAQAPPGLAASRSPVEPRGAAQPWRVPSFVCEPHTAAVQHWEPSCGGASPVCSPSFPSALVGPQLST